MQEDGAPPPADPRAKHKSEATGEGGERSAQAESRARKIRRRTKTYRMRPGEQAPPALKAARDVPGAVLVLALADAGALLQDFVTQAQSGSDSDGSNSDGEAPIPTLKHFTQLWARAEERRTRPSLTEAWRLFGCFIFCPRVPVLTFLSLSLQHSLSLRP